MNDLPESLHHVALSYRPDGNWTIIADAPCKPTAAIEETLSTAIENADVAVRAIVVADSSATPFDPWTRLPRLLAALIPRVDCPLVVAIREVNNVEFADVSEPLRDQLIAMAKTGPDEIGVCGCHLDSTSPAKRPQLAPASPSSESTRLRDHLEDVTVNDVLPDAVSDSDAVALLAGLWQLNDFLDRSHSESQSVEGDGRHRAGDYWHAIMHRREPDYSNAKYWFRRVGEHPVFPLLAAQTTTLLSESDAISQPWRERLLSANRWNPLAFVDFCEDALAANDAEAIRVAERIQWAEMLLLLEQTFRDAAGT